MLSRVLVCAIRLSDSAISDKIVAFLSQLQLFCCISHYLMCKFLAQNGFLTPVRTVAMPKRNPETDVPE